MLRAPRKEESAEIAALLSVYSPEPVAEERVRTNWSAPGIDMDRDSRVVVQDGQVVGFASIEVEETHVWLELHGEHALSLIDWALPLAPGRIYSGGWQQNAGVRAALLEKGFTLVRHSYRMGIDLGGPQPEPQWPDGLGVRGFRVGDERGVYETHMETFEDSWEHTRQSYEEWAHWTLDREGFDPQLWRLAMAGDELAGIALCAVRPSQPETGWVGILGVRRPWRRRGLGRALLQEAFRALGARGCSRAVLGVDASSLTGAHRLYESAGMRVLATFDIYERPA